MYISNCCNSVPLNDILHEVEGIQIGNCLECGEYAKFKDIDDPNDEIVKILSNSIKKRKTDIEYNIRKWKDR